MFELFNTTSFAALSIVAVFAGMALCWIIGAPLIILFKGNHQVTDFICNAVMNITGVLLLIMIFCLFRWLLSMF